jgi:hypothetical protein
MFAAADDFSESSFSCPAVLTYNPMKYLIRLLADDSRIAERHERSVIVRDTENFSVDGSWLSRRPLATEPNRRLGLSKNLPSQEKAIIEIALTESGERVSEPLGAAANLQRSDLRL